MFAIAGRHRTATITHSRIAGRKEAFKLKLMMDNYNFMNIIDIQNGNLNIPGVNTITPAMDYDVLKQNLLDKNIDFTYEDHYNNLFGSIYINKIESGDTTFQFELHFNNKKLTGITLGFTTTDTPQDIESKLQCYQEWVTIIKGMETDIPWGSILAEIHPRFDVPIISVRYNL